jgi:hypothetical protein
MEALKIIFISCMLFGCNQKNKFGNDLMEIDDAKLTLRYNISISELRKIYTQKNQQDPFSVPEKYNPERLLALSGIRLEGASIGMDYSKNLLIIEAKPTTHKDIQILIGRPPLE